MRLAQCTYCQFSHHIGLVFDWTSSIALWLRGSGSQSDRLVNAGVVQRFTEQRLFSVAGFNWNRSNIGQANTCIAHIAVAVQRNISRHTGNGIVSHLALELEIRSVAPLLGRRNANLSQHLVS